MERMGVLQKLKLLGMRFVFQKKKGWIGAEKSGNLEHFLYDETYLEFVCSFWFSLHCMGPNLFVEMEKLLECKHPPKLL
jgi:hypothetical protein